MTQLDQVMRGGIPISSLTLIEGNPSAGKSVLCYHMTYESLLDGQDVAYFTSAEDLAAQMASVGLDMSDPLRDGRLSVLPVGDPESGRGADAELDLLLDQMERLPSGYTVVIVDSISDVARRVSDNDLVSFFSTCQALSKEGRTIIVTARSVAFDRRLVARLHSLCNNHIEIRDDSIGNRVAKAVEVSKVRQVELSQRNVVRFEIVAGIGARFLPGEKVRVWALFQTTRQPLLLSQSNSDVMPRSEATKHLVAGSGAAPGNPAASDRPHSRPLASLWVTLRN